MRQIGSLGNEQQAKTLADYLISQGIISHAESEGTDWGIWVREENQVPAAKTIFTEFQGNPSDPKYAAAAAEAQRRKAELARQKVANNTIDMRRQWSAPLRRRAPVVFTLIIVSVFATLFGDRADGLIRSAFSFCEPRVYAETRGDGLAQIKQGQVWRLITPIFPHGNLLHLFFNMWVLYGLGPQVENRRGGIRFAGIVLLLALASNVLQYAMVGPNFLGMSGVVYGLLGYIWMRQVFDPRSAYMISDSTIAFMLIFFAMGFLGDFTSSGGSGIANWAHAGGLLAGMAIGYFPTLWKR